MYREEYSPRRRGGGDTTYYEKYKTEYPDDYRTPKLQKVVLAGFDVF